MRILKRKASNNSNDEPEEINFLNKIPRLDGSERETDAISYRFDFSLQHIASVNLLYSKCIEYMKEEVVKMNYRNCSGPIYFADIMLKYLHNTLPYFSNITVKLGSMVNQVVKSIYNWIRYEDRYIYNIRCVRQSVVIEYVHCIEITNRGTIDYAKTAEQLLKHPKIDDVDKLKIVCVHCLDRYIFSIMNCLKIPLNLPKFYVGTVQMIDFWKTCLSNGDFLNPVYNVDEQTLNAVGPNTEALKFLWNKLNGEEKSHVLMKLIRRSEADFQCFLLSQLDGHQQQNVFKNCGGVILNNLYDDFVWGDYVLTTAFHARNVISSRQYYDFMKRIIFCMQFDKKKYKNELIFRQLWQYATKRIKDLIFRHENANIFYWFRNEISADHMLTLFSDASVDFKQNFIHSDSCINACFQLIKTDKFEVLENMINNTLVNDNQITNFKQVLLSHQRYCDVICHMVNIGNKQKFETVMNWFFISKKEKDIFKQKFTTTNAYLNLFNDMFARAVYENVSENNPREKVMFVELNEKIGWFLSSSGDVRVFKKMVLANFRGFSGIIYELVKLERYSLVEELLRWCINEPLYEDIFKMKLYSNENKCQNIDLVFKLIWKSDEFQALDEFVDWCFGINESKIREFKTSILGAFKEAHKLWGSLLYREEYHFADELIKWCGMRNSQEILNYKNELMLNLDLEYVTNDVKYFLEKRDGEVLSNTEADMLYRCRNLIRWFAPSVETFHKFANFMLINKVKYGKFCNLVRMYLEENEVDGFA